MHGQVKKKVKTGFYMIMKIWAQVSVLLAEKNVFKWIRQFRGTVTTLYVWILSVKYCTPFPSPYKCLVKACLNGLLILLLMFLHCAVITYHTKMFRKLVKPLLLVQYCRGLKTGCTGRPEQTRATCDSQPLMTLLEWPGKSFFQELRKYNEARMSFIKLAL